jgi:hypothetical protein
VVVCVAAGGCGNKTERAQVPSTVAEDSAATADDVAAWVAELADPDQAKRDAAAGALRDALVDERLAAEVDRGEAYWAPRVAALDDGMTVAEVERALPAEQGAGASSGTSMTVQFRLDDYWTLEAYFDTRNDPARLFEVGPLSHSIHYVWIDPPDGYTGRWMTYHVNGALAYDIDYLTGTYARFRSYYASGQLVYEQLYVDGKVHGPAAGFHEDGAKSYTGRYDAGKQTGAWVHWHPNGVKASEQTYVDGTLDGVATTWRADGSKSLERFMRAGTETGQASWDERGVLQYAHGEAADRYK